MKKRLPHTVIALGFASFFTDFSSEMIYPLLPVFLTTVLGAGAISLGIIEGVAESTASLFKVVSGIWTDRARRRMPFILAGYGLAGLVRPLIGLAGSWHTVLGLRFTDRIGKGLRTSPRDALVADVTDPPQRGAAFGFHRSMDHGGAVVGPLVAAALLHFNMSFRQVFLLAVVPAAVVMIVLLRGVREPAVPRNVVAGFSPRSTFGHWHELGRDFRLLLLAVFIFTLGNSTDAFLLLRLSDAGVPATWTAVLWSFHHVVKMLATYFGGRLADVAGCRVMIFGGWLFYALIYVLFASVDSVALLIGVFLAYGIYFGLTEPAERAWIAQLVPAHLRGTAFGYYNSAVGIGALPASILFGALWNAFGVHVAFAVGAAFAIVASALLLRKWGHSHKN
ncbi:MAG: MFS transporter [Acidobacteria bacterium]|nr:MAG: MFS transporter [Acidobacteriota bacterium]